MAEPADALATWLRRHGVGARVTVLGRTTVGLSQETWFVRVGDADAVLRLPTPASGARQIVTQRVALHAVEGHGLPVPEVLWFDDADANEFSRPFIVMERCAGEVPVGWHELDEPRRTALAEHAIDALAALHELDPAPLAAAAAGRPLPSSLAWVQRRLERVAPLPLVVTSALRWLERNEPPAPGRLAIVHNDYRMGNMVVDGDRVTGILDWELAAPGDPAADVAWCFIPVWEHPGVDEDALVRRYGQRRGEPLEPERVHWYRVLGYTRLAYYALSGLRAFDTGRSDDLRLAALRLALPVHLDRLAATLANEEVSS